MRLQKKKQEFEEKGFIFDLYHYLWEDEEQQQNKQNTIYYKYGEPRLWFFTDKNGHVKKKMKNKLTIEKIEEEFLDKTPQCDIVAFFIWTSQNGQNYRFEYYNPEAFVKFLYTKSYEKEGYLCRFIQSKGTHNQIRVKIRQYITIQDILSNQLKIYNSFNFKIKLSYKQQQLKQYGLQKYVFMRNIRISSQQMTQHQIYTKEQQIQNRPKTNVKQVKPQNSYLINQLLNIQYQTQLKGKSLPIKINELTEELASHLEKVSTTKKKIRQMELIYKLDSNDKLYLLFCQNIISERTYEQQQEQNKEFNYSIPNYINTDKIQLPRPLNLNKSNQCLNCEKLLDEESVYQIDLDTIIQAWDFDHIAEDQYLAEYEINKNEKLLKKQKEAKQLNPLEKRKDATFNFYSIAKNYQVPNVLRRVFPNLEYEDLLNNRENAIFQVQKITVCEECYLKVLDSAHYGQNLKNLAKYIIKSSVHKTDDLVPLKNDRIFFHKFKTQALTQERKQKNKSFGKSISSQKNSLMIDPYLTQDNIQGNNSDSSRILTSCFSSKHQIDSSGSVHKQMSSLYLKFPFIEMNKTYKPLKMAYNLTQQTTKSMNDEEIKTLTMQNKDTTVDKDFTINQTSEQEYMSIQQKEEKSQQIPIQSSPYAKTRQEFMNKQMEKKKSQKRFQLPSPDYNKAQNYHVSYDQYKRLAKLYPKEMNNLNIQTNNYEKYKNESHNKSKQSESISTSQKQLKVQNKKLPKLKEDKK